MYVRSLKRHVEIHALDEKNTYSYSSQVYLAGVDYNGVTINALNLPGPSVGKWQTYDFHYCWIPENDDRIIEPITKSIRYDIDLYNSTTFIFSGNSWKGKALVIVDGWEKEIDTYVESDSWVDVFLFLPKAGVYEFIRYIVFPAMSFGITAFLIYVFMNKVLSFRRQHGSNIINNNS